MSTKIKTNQRWHAKTKTLSGSVAIWHLIRPGYTNSPIQQNYVKMARKICAHNHHHHHHRHHHHPHVSLRRIYFISMNRFWVYRLCACRNLPINAFGPIFCTNLCGIHKKKKKSSVTHSCFIPSITLGGLEHHIHQFRIIPRNLNIQLACVFLFDLRTSKRGNKAFSTNSVRWPRLDSVDL